MFRHYFTIAIPKTKRVMFVIKFVMIVTLFVKAIYNNIDLSIMIDFIEFINFIDFAD